MVDNTSGSSDSPSLQELGGRVREDLLQLREAALRRRDEWVADARQFVQSHPLTVVGGAFAVGYLLAGGLLSRTTGRLFTLGLRLYAARLLRSAVGIATAPSGNGSR